MSVTGSLIKISLNIKQCALRQLLWALQPSKVKCDGQSGEATPNWTCTCLVPGAGFTG